MSQFNSLHNRAKQLEARLEVKIQKYSSIAQQINADILCDEERPLVEGHEEQDLASEIERDLTELSDCINSMRACTANISGSHQNVLIKRYQEIHFDYNSEFKNTSSTVQRKRESLELFQSSKNLHTNTGQDSSVAKLLRERNSIAQSMRSINEVISQAFETRSSLSHQRSTLTNSAGGLSGLASNVPSFNRLIDGINKKRTRESVIVAIVIAVLLCFTIWWVFLR